MTRDHKKIISQAALGIADKVFARTFDGALWMVAYLGSMSVPQSTYGQIWRAGKFADEFIEQVNFEAFKRAIAEARRRGFIKKQTRGKRTWPEISKAGKQRLTSLMPVYNEKRVWDGQIYLITYDIPETASHDRDKLRTFIKTLGCGRLQDSVWVTPYDPSDLVTVYIRDSHIDGMVIISRIGKDGYIGQDTIGELLAHVYNLKSLNKKYEEWIASVGHHELSQSALLSYISVLKNDPQLPFPLLPVRWKGNEAYEIVKPMLKRIGNSLATA